jgi:hypothetical protein
MFRQIPTTTFTSNRKPSGPLRTLDRDSHQFYDVNKPTYVPENPIIFIPDTGDITIIQLMNIFFQYGFQPIREIITDQEFDEEDGTQRNTAVIHFQDGLWSHNPFCVNMHRAILERGSANFNYGYDLDEDKALSFTIKHATMEQQQQQKYDEIAEYKRTIYLLEQEIQTVKEAAEDDRLNVISLQEELAYAVTRNTTNDDEELEQEITMHNEYVNNA